MTLLRAALAGTVATLLAPAIGQAATLTTDKPCYTQVATKKGIIAQRLTATGAGWAPGSTWGLQTTGIDSSGLVDASGNFAAAGNPPAISRDAFTPQQFTLNGLQDGTPVAQTTFSVVNFNVRPNKSEGKPTGTTVWHFSGFVPKKKIYFHLTKSGSTFTSSAGKAKGPCGTLKKRLKRLPGVPASRISYGKYRFYVDQRRKLVKNSGLQFRASIKIKKVFVR